MLSHQPKQTAYLVSVVEAILLAAAFIAAYQIRLHFTLPFTLTAEPDFASHFWLLAVAIPLFWALGRTHARRVPVPGAGHALRDLLVRFATMSLILGTCIFLFQAKTFSRAVFFLFLALAFLFIGAARLVFRAKATGRDDASRRNVVVVGTSLQAREFSRALAASPEYRVNFLGYLTGPDEPAPADLDSGQVLGSIDDLRNIVEDRIVDDVVFAVPSSKIHLLEDSVAWCEEVGVAVHLKMDLLRTLVAKSAPTEVNGVPLLTLATTPHDAGALMIKRLIDIVISATALTLSAPVLALVALLVRLTSRGPVIFRQQRVGLNGRLFDVYKFRSMYRGAEKKKAEVEAKNEMSGPVFKMANDPRITPVGRWLRRYSLDEFPQLWNVLRGDMSLVGPRPPLASEVREYQRWQRRRLSMKPGITCLWQVGGRNEVPFETWMRLDLDYIDNWSLALDLKILLRTVPAVVLARGAR